MTKRIIEDRQVRDMGQGDHLCLAFDDDEEQRRVVTAYLRDGLERGERVVYYADQCTPRQVLDWLREAGTDPGEALSDGRLQVTTAGAGYLAAGPFDPDAMVAALNREVADALAAGYTGFRVSGEMGWALRGVPGAERLAEYERKVDAVFAAGRASAICQYDARRFDAAALHAFGRAHPGMVEAVPLHSSSTLRLVPSFHRGRRSLRVEGDVDFHSAEALAAALRTAEGWPGDITVDTGNLHFLDLAGIRALVRTAERLSPGRRLHVVDLDPMLQHVISVVGWDQEPALAVTARETAG
ncbi:MULTISPECIES: MEDS domain-containing protein [unclassified Kitasatospora]|uniref:MEDS domain-containing protein n=1 Tax=unclassified Kitasatospora TaxID=2633591 RepID=UPI0037FB6EE1